MFTGRGIKIKAGLWAHSVWLPLAAVFLSMAVACEDEKVIRSTVGEPSPESAPSKEGTPSRNSARATGSTIPTPEAETERTSRLPQAKETVAAGSGPETRPSPASSAPAGDEGTQGTRSRASEVSPQSALSSLPSFTKLDKESCEKGVASGCLRHAKAEMLAGREREAVRFYIKACTTADYQTPGACKSRESNSSDAWGCYKAASLEKGGEAKALLQCACDKGYVPACNEVVRIK